MRAIVYDRYGPPESLRLEDVPVPEPGPGEVRVAVHAASVNSWDWDWLVGKALIRPFAPFKPKYRILGCDLAGVVDAVGAGVDGLEVGDAVFGDISEGHWGAFAEYACADAAKLAYKPEELDFEVAAALPQAGVLALQGLRQGGAPKMEQRILLNGGGGGVGTIALQLARQAGADVTCVDAADKLERLIALGADAAFDYRTEDVTVGDARFDLVLDMIGTRPVHEWRRVLAGDGSYVMVGGTIRNILRTLVSGALRARRGAKLGILPHQPNTDDLDTLAEACVAGELAPVIDRVQPLEELPEALRAIGAGEVFGKRVIRIR